MMPELAQMLREAKMASRYKTDRDPIFPTPTGRHRTQASATMSVRRAFDRAGLLDATYHALRHTYASSLLRAGIDLESVSRAMGHSSSVVTLSTYSHALDRSQVEDEIRDGLSARYGQHFAS
jgi:site-specific recombinase XerD